jgi:WD40 repeat protein
MNPSTVSPFSGPGLSTTPSPAVARVFDDRPFRADGDLLALAFTADGTLWSVEDPGLLRRWDMAGSRQLEWNFLSELENLWVFNRDGRVLVSASDEVSVWDVASGQLLAVMPQPSWVTALGISVDAARVTTGHEDGSVRIWDVANDELILEVSSAHEGPVSAVAFSADGSRLATAGEDRIIYIWDVATRKEVGVLDGHFDRIPALVWHPQGHRIYSASWDTAVWVWDIKTEEPIILLNSHEKQLHAIAISADGNRLAVTDSAQSVHLWDLTTHRQLRVFRGYDGEARALAFSPDGQTLASGGNDRIIHLWRPETDVPADGWSGPHGAGFLTQNNEVRSGLALSPDAARLASIRPGRGVRVWDAASSAAVLDLEEVGELHAVAYSADGRWIAAGGADNSVRVWDAATGRKQATLEGPTLPVTALVFAPNAPVVASASAVGCDVWLWNTESGEPTLLIPDAIDGCSVEALAFGPRGDTFAAGGVDWMATGGSDGAVHVWNLIQPGRIATLPGGARALAFHPEGRLLAAASLTRTIRVWDVTEARLVAELCGHDDAVTCVAFSRDGHWLASGSDDRTVRLWDAESGALLGTTELDAQIRVLCFSPDGSSLFTGNGNSSAYQLKTQRLLNGVH